MQTSDRKLRVFLCHASQDKPIVRELYQRLLAEGWIDPWLDEEKLLPGQDWDMEIEKAVESADVVIVFLSSNSVSREGYIQKELRYVLDMALEKPEGAIFVIPLRLDDCQIPRRLRAWQILDYNFADRRKNYLRLMESLKLRFNANETNDPERSGENLSELLRKSSAESGEIESPSVKSEYQQTAILSDFPLARIKFYPYLEWYISIGIGIAPYVIFAYLLFPEIFQEYYLLNYTFLGLCLILIAIWQRKIILRCHGKGSTWAILSSLYWPVFILTDFLTVDKFNVLWFAVNGLWYFGQLIFGPIFVLRKSIVSSHSK